MYLGLRAQTEKGLTNTRITEMLERSLDGLALKKVLILPPDFTRYHSGAGFITCEYRRMLRERGCRVDIMPALGTHEPVSRSQWEKLFPGIPYEELLVHNWRSDVTCLGEVPGEYLAEITGGLWTDPVSCEVNRLVMDESYDLILSVGQVVPHEVVGMSNESKNLFVIADNGELIVLAPGVARFGEDLEVDGLIRKYGYNGRLRILEEFRRNKDLQENMSAAAHLIQGSSDGRFSITYAVKGISREEVEGVGFHAAGYDEMIQKYDPGKLSYGWNTMPDGEEIYYIPNPALGLWIDRGRFEDKA